MKKLIQYLTLVLFSISLAGCSQKASADAFFKSYQALLEQDSIKAEGTLSFNEISYGIELGADRTENAFMLSLEGPFDFSFWLIDGMAYIDEDGQRYKTPAENYDLQSFSWRSLNPFLSLSLQQRQDLFGSVMLSGNTYTMIFNNTMLSAMLDDYGAFTIGSARMEADIVSERLEAIRLEIYGRLNYGQGADFNMDLDLSFESDRSFELPADPDSWPLAEQTDGTLFLDQ